MTDPVHPFAPAAGRNRQTAHAREVRLRTRVGKDPDLKRVLTERDTYRAKVVEIAAENAALKEQLANVPATKAAAAREIAELKAELKDLQGHLAHQIEARQQAEEREQVVRGAKTLLAGHVDDLKKAHRELSEQVQALTVERDTAQQALADARVDAEAVSAGIAHLREELEACKGTRAILAENRRLQERVARLEAGEAKFAGKQSTRSSAAGPAPETESGSADITPADLA